VDTRKESGVFLRHQPASLEQPMKKPAKQTLAKWLVGCLGIISIGILIYLLPVGRELAVTVLGKLGPVSTPLLRHALHDEDNMVRWAAHDALVALGGKAVPSHVQALHDKNPQIRAEAAEAFYTIRSTAKEALPALAEAFNDPDDNVRGKAMWVLQFIVEDPEDALPLVPPLLAIIQDEPKGHIRAQAVEAASILGCHGAAKPVASVLIRSLKDPDAEVRQEAAEGLSRFGRNRLLPPEAIPALKEALSDPNRNVRSEAAEALTAARIGENVSVDKH
jgi:HEAT repeat protein